MTYRDSHQRIPEYLNTAKFQQINKVMHLMKAIHPRQPKPAQLSTRHTGEPATLIADASRIRTQLGWQPKHVSWRRSSRSHGQGTKRGQDYPNRWIQACWAVT
jgi:UDP-glucose 4-epimerase